MSLKVYIEEDFEHEHEAAQAADLCRRLSAQIPADAYYTLIFNFYLNGKQLDSLLITPHRFIVIDFKYVRAPLSELDANRPWKCVDGYELEGSGYGNPFKQVTQYRRHLGQALLNYQREVFVGGRVGRNAGKLDFGSATGLVLGGICLGPDVKSREPICDECGFPKWFFFGRPQAFADKCLMVCHGEPVALNENVHRAFVSCISGLRRAIIGQDGVPKVPQPVRLRPSSDGAVASTVVPNLEITENTTTDEVVASIGSALDGGTRCFIISGAAGTGKTTLIKQLIPVLEGKGFTPALMAPTGRAAKMMSQRTGTHADTIHSTIYKRPDQPIVDDTGDAVCFVFPLKPVCPPSAAIIVDESSMVSLAVQNNELLRFGSGSLLEDLITYSGVRREECSNILIFIGDHCQLKPIGEKCNVPPALDSETIKGLTGHEPMMIELKKVYRQGENSGILDEAIRIRAGLTYGRFDHFHYREHPDVVTCPEDDALKLFKPNEEIDDKIIIAQTNVSVWNYNNQIRQLLRRDTVALAEGERLMSLRNTHVPIGEDGYEEAFMNGDFLKLDALPNEDPCLLTGFYRVKGSDHALVFNFTFRKMTVSWPYEPDRAQVTVWVNISPILSQDWRETPEYASMALYNAVRHAIMKKFPKLSHKELQDKLRENVLLRAPIVTYGYAITGHKSQGGEWKYVWVDYHYAQNRQTDDYFRWAYTVTTRAKKTLYAIAPPSFDQLADILSFDGVPDMPVKNETAQKPLSQVLAESGYEIKQVTERPYAYRVFVRRPNEDVPNAFASQYVDVIYNGKNLVSNIDIHIADIPDEDKTRVRAVVGMTIRAAMEGRQGANPPSSQSSSERSTRRQPVLTVRPAHEYTARRIREAVEYAHYTLLSVGSLTEHQLRATVEHQQGSGYFDVYFDGRGRVTHLGTYTLPIPVLKEIRKGL